MSLSQTASVVFTLTVDVALPEVSAVMLNGSAGPCSVVLQVNNAGADIGVLTVTTRSGTPYTQPLALTGTDGAKFALGNGGVLPCSLKVGTTSLTSGSYSVGIKAS